jgi:ketosteroid isomerase-like protein
MDARILNLYNPLQRSGRKECSMADPVSMVKDYDAAWNAHDVEGVLAFFTDDAVAKWEPPPPDDEFGGVYSGKEQIRAGFVEPLMPGFHVESRDHQVGGDRVTWTARLWNDAFKQMGAGLPVESPAEAILEGDKIKFFIGTLPGLPPTGIA